MTIQELLDLGRQQINSDSARLDCELLLAFCLQRNRSYLYAWPEKEVSADTAAQFQALITRRHNGEPIAYLLGEKEFWSLTLNVDNSTLIPRPETERLVEVALRLSDDRAHVLDLGTGTGAIALALAKERPRWQVLGLDLNPRAVELAARNAQRNGITNAEFRQSDWFATLTEPDRFELIVANPPYIDSADPHLQQGDVRFEPRSALVADNGGLADLAAIAAAARSFLAANGWLLMEHGFAQASAVRAELSARGYADVTTWCDDGGRERITGGLWKGVRHE